MIDNNFQGVKSFCAFPSDQVKTRTWLGWAAFVFITVVVCGCASKPPHALDTELTPSPPGISPPLPITTATTTDQPAQIPLPSPTPTPSPEPNLELSLQVINIANVDQIMPILNLIGHKAPVLAVEYSPDGSLIASGSEDNRVRLWDPRDGSLVYELIGHTDFVNDLSFSPDGLILASGSNDGTVRFWNVDNGSLIRVIDSGLMDRVLNVEFSPTGTLIAIGGHKCFIELRKVSSGIYFRSLHQPRCVERYRGTTSYWGMDFTSDGQEIIIGEGRSCCGGSVQRREVEKYTPPTLLEGYQLRVRDLDISPDDSTLTIAFIGSPVFWLMDIADGSLLQTFEGHTFRVNSVVFSPDGDLIASGSRDRTINLWTLDGALLNHLEGHGDAVNSVAFSPTGDLLASASDDGTIIVWGVP